MAQDTKALKIYAAIEKFAQTEFNVNIVFIKDPDHHVPNANAADSLAFVGRLIEGHGSSRILSMKTDILAEEIGEEAAKRLIRIDHGHNDLSPEEKIKTLLIYTDFMELGFKLLQFASTLTNIMHRMPKENITIDSLKEFGSMNLHHLSFDIDKFFLDNAGYLESIKHPKMDLLFDNLKRFSREYKHTIGKEIVGRRIE